jgi:hypothetical protein
MDHKADPEGGKLVITPKTRVGELLDAYPQLEPVLMELAPAFKKLRNPVLRKTVGKVATLQQAAAVGNIPLSEIINTLRAKVGQEMFHDAGSGELVNTIQPDWYVPGKITVTFDASSMINRGENPMQEAFRHLDMTGPGEIYRLTAPFVPAPLIELISKKGYEHYCRQEGPQSWETFFIFRG